MTKIKSYRLDPKMIELAKERFGVETETAAIRQALTHVLTCHTFEEETLFTYSVKDFVDMFGVQKSAVYRYIEAGVLNATYIGAYVIFPEDIITYLQHFNDEIPSDVVALIGKFGTDCNEFLRPKDAIEKYDIAERTMYDWIQKGKVRSLRVSKCRYLVYEKSVRRRVLNQRPTVTKQE